MLPPPKTSDQKCMSQILTTTSIIRSLRISLSVRIRTHLPVTFVVVVVLSFRYTCKLERYLLNISGLTKPIVWPNIIQTIARVLKPCIHLISPLSALVVVDESAVFFELLSPSLQMTRRLTLSEKHNMKALRQL